MTVAMAMLTALPAKRETAMATADSPVSSRIAARERDRSTKSSCVGGRRSELLHNVNASQEMRPKLISCWVAQPNDVLPLLFQTLFYFNGMHDGSQIHKANLCLKRK